MLFVFVVDDAIDKETQPTPGNEEKERESTEAKHALNLL